MFKQDGRQPAFSLQPAGVALGPTNQANLPWLFAQGANDDDDTVRVQRRRRAAPGGPEGRERADAPQRRRGDEGPPSSTGGGGGGSGRPPRPGGQLPGGQLPGGMNWIVIVVLIAAVIFGLPNLLNQGASGPQEDVVNAPVNQAPVAQEQAAEATPTRAAAQAAATPTRQTAKQPTKAPTARPAGVGATAGQSWTILLYQDADDKVLERDIYVDLNEAERIGSSERVNIVAQVDRYQAGFQGDGNWASTKRFYVTQDDDLQRVGSRQLADLGEVNMADGKTLVDFVTWGIKNYPADKYVLILSDHGLGWPGGWSDPSPGGRPDRSIPLSQAMGDQLYLMEMDQALGEIRQQTGLDKFEMIGLDACLMAHIEVFSALAPHARYSVASQETEPSLGWAYTSFLGALTANPDMDGAELSRLIVESYITDDQRIVDDQERVELVARGQPMGGLFGLLGAVDLPSAQEVAQQMAQNVTLTAFDLSQTQVLIDALNGLSNELQRVNQRGVAKARSYAQSYTSIFGPDVPASYIDLGHFTQVLQQMGANGAVGQAINQVQGALQQAVIAEKHGANKPGSSGVSIYFPISELYRSPLAGAASYTVAARRFAESSLWDEFLTFHYTGETFEPTTNRVAAPRQSAAVRGPATGGIEVAPIERSAEVAAPGDPVLLSTRISGENIGYVYLFAGFYDQSANSILVVDTDFLESSDTREVNGVYYPVWPEDGDFTLEFEWEPLVFAVSDGTTSEVALFTPQTYGADAQATIYTVDGVYTFVDGGDTRAARLYFRDGVLRQIFAFTNEDASGAPREITPQLGDTFTILEQWMDLDQNGRVTQMTKQAGGVLTIGEEPITLREMDAAAGDYVVGFIVKDLDGQATEVYTQVRVR